MGQLIKLQDYVSRYQQDIYVYPSRFVRLKKQQWDKWHKAWEANESYQPQFAQHYPSGTADWADEEKEPLMEKLKGLLKRGRNEDDEEYDASGIEGKKAEDALEFEASFAVRPETIENLKHQFLDQLYRFQLKWASSTLTEKSFPDKQYYYDENLKYFLQRYPDTYLVMYNPIFLLKKAPVETETIVISPTEVWCISFLEQEDSAVFTGSKDRFWIKRGKGEEKKVLNPLLALNRTEKIIRKIFEIQSIELPVKKAVLTRNGYIDYPAAPIDVQLIEKRTYNQWFQAIRSQRSPLKHAQIKGAQALLQYCQTSSVKRLEWENRDES
ncbi:MULTISPECIES: nuclease-related domain-containing protein [unclassified Cytobacillus]|uniref:nuclease-related domain-containing protein n=1 Tax=unclassified Cytobacillus TaxID=2675268 RepID=UPI00203A524A|nr:nuclease-related domain-containing protein [Cytobacillus sp. AMY 15.2]MCM3091943.1 NERD domain-containing protein [Cytobacillus sp. AMY 15.2]